MTDVMIGGDKYRIIRRIYTDGFWASDDFKSRIDFFTAINEPIGGAILANYGKYWGAGENYYDATKSLYAQMFIANCDKFIRIIDSEKQKTRK